MIHIKNNECPICMTEDLDWNINIHRSDMHLFKCGHGTCKSCFNSLRSTTVGFCCPLCRDSGQQHYLNFQSNKQGMWLTFAEWYSEYEIFIKAGAANNVVHNSSFGKQLLRLIRESKKQKKRTKQ
jgi:hypothetical protein